MEVNIALVVHGLAQGAVLALIAIGYSLIYRSTGLLNLAFGELVMIGGFVGFTSLVWGGMPFVAAALTCMVVIAIISYLMEVAIFQPILRKGNIANALIASLGLLIVINQVGLLIWGADPLSYPESSDGGSVQVGPATVAVQNLWIMGACLVAVLALQWFLRKTMVGVGIRAAAEDRVASQLVGISPARSASLAAVISGAMAGLAGILLGSLYFASYSLGAIGIKGIAAATIGGFGDIRGAIVGGVLLGIAESMSTAYLPAISIIIAWVFMIVVLMIRPQGILGIAGRRD